ncbi:MAG: hypothetical protein WCJ30_15370, partial [Deltaproteobacteria bacterium]
VAFATGQSRFRTVNGVPLARLDAAWKECVSGMEFALNFMRSNAGIESPALLSSPFILVTLAYLAHARGYEISAEESQRLRSWVLIANAKGRYSRGSSETFLDQDLAAVRNGGGATELMEKLRLQVGKLDIDPEELEGRNRRSALFKTMFLAFRAAGAKDWASNLSIALDHSGAHHRLQFHHIFPKAVLKGSYTAREADDIANMAFIGGKTNRKISDKAPVLYFPATLEKAGKPAFEAQCIPTDGALLGTEQYKNFLAKRRKRIALRLNEFLGTGGS